MNNLKGIKLGEFIDFSPSRTLRKNTLCKKIPMDLLNSNTREITSYVLEQYTGSGTKFQNGDTLLARITPCLENGKTAYVSHLDDNEIAFGSTEFIVMRGIPNVSENKFIYYLARDPKFREYAIQHMEGTSGRQRVSADTLANYEILDPSYCEQRVISNLLGSLDDKIEANRKGNETLEAMAQALFKSWFVDFEPFGGEMPVDWEESPLEDIAIYLNGLALQKYPAKPGQTSLPVIKIAELNRGITDNTDRASTEIPPEYIVHDGDVIFSWSGSLTIVLWTGGDGALNQHLFKVFSDEYPKWFYYLWTKHHMPFFQMIAQSKATTMGHIKREHLREVKVFVPNTDQMQKMTELMEPLIDKIILNSMQSQTLASVRDTLLPRLMSGKIRVPLDIKDEQ